MKPQLSLLTIVICFFMTPMFGQSNGLSVYNILQENCIACHSNGSPAANLDLEGIGQTEAERWTSVYNTSLVGRIPGNQYARDEGYEIIYPGRADLSYLFRKITGDFEPTISLDAQAGGSMPQDNPGGLSDYDKEIIRQWILYGAQKNGTAFDEEVVEDYYVNGGGESFPNGAPAPPAAEEGFQIKMGPFFLAPGDSPGHELEYFQKYELKLAEDTEVIRLDSKFSGSSHHFIAYSYDTPQSANFIPEGLRLESYHNDVSLVMAVQEQTDIVLPNGAAFMWDNDLILDLNSHYINYQLNEPYKSEVYLNVYTQEAGTAKQEMYTGLIANGSIFIPNNEEDVSFTEVITEPSLGNIYLWGLMGHTHKYGTGYKVWTRKNGVIDELIYDGACAEGVPECVFPDFDYQHIPFSYYHDFLPVNMGNSNGLVHQASWNNDGPFNVFFGPTSEDEMMVLVLMYLRSLDGITVTDTDDLTITESGVDVFPNPMTDYTEFLIHSNSNKPSSLELYDNLGRLVFTKDKFNNYYRLDKGNLTPGIYYYQIANEGISLDSGKLMIN